MLREIQRTLSELYDLHEAPDVEQFVCGEEVLRAVVGDGAAARGEVLLVFEEDDHLHLGLYLHPDVLAQIAGRSPDFRALCLATEGVSHFLYLSFRAGNEEQVSQLELELQAEVDKYAAGLLAGNGAGLVATRSRALRQRLFDRARFLDPPDTPEGERYRVAHRAAARYAAALEKRYIEPGRIGELCAELRRFYRLGAREKLERAAG